MNEIKHFMTATAHAIGRDQPLKLAHERMHQFGIHHLPVLDGGVLVGVISERDIALLGAIAPDQVAETSVEDAMSTEPYAVAPSDDIVRVAATMAEHRYGCAVVIDHNKVVGIFTTTDALHVLSLLLREVNGSDAAKKIMRSVASDAAARQK
jgi:acetoin utilization protein AcuB